jgi:hypothetical protein
MNVVTHPEPDFSISLTTITVKWTHLSMNRDKGPVQNVAESANMDQ